MDQLNESEPTPTRIRSAKTKRPSVVNCYSSAQSRGGHIVPKVLIIAFAQRIAKDELWPAEIIMALGNVTPEDYDTTLEYGDIEIQNANEENLDKAEVLAKHYIKLYKENISLRFAPNREGDQMIVLQPGPSRWQDWHKAPNGLYVMPRRLYDYAIILSRVGVNTKAREIAQLMQTNPNAPYTYANDLAKIMGVGRDEAIAKFNTMLCDIGKKKPSLVRLKRGGKAISGHAGE